MRAGVTRLPLGEPLTVSAPASGVQLGVGSGGPVSLRLFRLAGTRVLAATRPLPVQLLVIRVAAAGTPVQVITSRPQLWEPLLGHDPRTHVVSAGDTGRGPGGPHLVVDDRPAGQRSGADIGTWQCRIDLRSQWAAGDIGGFTAADVALFGRVSPELAGRVGSAFGLGRRGAERLPELDDSAVALLRRGRVEYLALDPTDAERRLLASVDADADADGRVARY
jgi:hypothetical protein